MVYRNRRPDFETVGDSLEHITLESDNGGFVGDVTLLPHREA